LEGYQVASGIVENTEEPGLKTYWIGWTFVALGNNGLSSLGS
jgi:hypothetical protein